MSTSANLIAHPKSPGPSSTGSQLGLASRSRVLRDFVLLITVCLSVGLSVGLGMMVAVLALL
jgi:hypothetical protein